MTKTCQSLPQKIIILFCCISFSSCLKNKDSTANGPKSLVAITNYVVNGSINVSLDNTALTAAPLGFGTGITTASGGYAALSSGLHTIQLSSGANVLPEKTISFITGINYSLFVYDTLQGGKVKTLLLTDDLTHIDTIGLARFLQFIPEADSLTLKLKKDTLAYTFSDAYSGNKTVVSTLAFSQAIRPGIYQATLSRKGTAIFQQSALTITAGKLYSFVVRGVVNGTGDYKEGLSVVQHN